MKRKAALVLLAIVSLSRAALAQCEPVDFKCVTPGDDLEMQIAKAAEASFSCFDVGELDDEGELIPPGSLPPDQAPALVHKYGDAGLPAYTRLLEHCPDNALSHFALRTMALTQTPASRTALAALWTASSRDVGRRRRISRRS